MPPEEQKKVRTIEEFLEEPDIKKILEDAGKKVETKEPEEMSRPPENVPTSGQILSRLPLEMPKRTRDAIIFLIKESGERVTAKDMTALLKGRGLDANFEQVKKSMNRLVDEKLFSKTKIDGISYYEFRKEEQVEQLTEEIGDLEKQLSDALMIDKPELPKVHKIILIFSKENVEHLHRDKRIGSLSLETLPETTEPTKDNILNTMLNPLHPDSIYQRWSKNAIQSNITDIKGGIQESIKVCEHTGFIGTLKAQIFGTGTLTMTFDFSEHPVDLFRWREFEHWLTGVMQGRCGYGFLDLTQHFTIMFEWSVDKLKRKFEGTGKYCWTVQQFDEVYMRIYSKEIDGKWVERKEVGLNEPVEYNHFIREAEAMMFGGVGMQWSIRQQHINEKFQKTISDFVISQTRVNRMNTSTLNTVLNRLSKQDDINKELLELLKKKKAE